MAEEFSDRFEDSETLRPSRKGTQAAEVEYILGYSESEVKRLVLQAEMIRPITERLLRSAGLAPGMRVLDVGCGAGDVAMLAASIVGPTGFVMGVDREEVGIKAAKHRAAASGLAIEYRQVGIEDHPDLGEFDVVIGRYVLVHQSDPVAFIKNVSAYTRSGGVIAFHEPLLTLDLVALNKAPLLNHLTRLVYSAMMAVMPHPEVAARLVETFHDAGFDGATASGDLLVYSGPESAIVSWFALVAKSVLPYLERTGRTTAQELDVDTLEQRLREEAASLHSQIIFASQFSAWVRK